MVKGQTAFDWSMYRDRGKVLISFLERREYVDALLVSHDGKQFFVHYAVMSTLGEEWTKVMKSKMDTSEVMEIKSDSGELCKVKKIVFNDISGKTLRVLVDCCYHGELSSDEKHIWEILDVAEAYKMKDVQLACCAYATTLVNPRNCMVLYQLGVQKNYRKLMVSTLRCMRHNFEQVKNSHFFSCIKDADFKKVLFADDLNIRSEEEVWPALKRWVNLHKEERGPKIGELIRGMRHLRVSVQFLEDLLRDPLIVQFAKHVLVKMLDDLKKCHLSTDGNGLFRAERRVARPRLPNGIIFALGGWKDGRTSCHLETYDRSTNEWFVINTRGGPLRAYHGVKWVDKKLFVVGGTDGRAILKKAHVFDPVTQTWEDLPDMSEQRCYVSTAILDKFLYAIGGHNGEFRTASVEKFNLDTQEWMEVAGMNVPRSDGAATVLDGKIYVIGGLNEGSIESTAEVYDPEKDEWTMIASMTTPRTSLSAVALKGKIYAIGGNDGTNRLDTVEMYDPITNSWSLTTSMNKKRSTFQATELDGQIIAIGGYDGQFPVAFAEKYDPHTRTWTEISDMNYSRSGLAVVTVYNCPDAKKFTWYRTLPVKVDNLAQRVGGLTLD